MPTAVCTVISLTIIHNRLSSITWTQNGRGGGVCSSFLLENRSIFYVTIRTNVIKVIDPPLDLYIKTTFTSISQSRYYCTPILLVQCYVGNEATHVDIPNGAPGTSLNWLVPGLGE